MPFHLRHLAAAGLAAGLAGPVAAAAIISSLTAGLGVSVGARVNNHVAADEWTTSDDTTIYGNARASTVGAQAGVEPGATWPQPCVNPACLPGGSVTDQTAHGQGEAHGDLGRLRTHAYAGVDEQNSAAARGEARIEDIVRFGAILTPRLELHIDGRGLGDNRGVALMDFTVFLGRHVCDRDQFPDGCFAPAFTFHAQNYEGTDLDSWFYGLGDGSSQRVEGRYLPDGGLDIVVDLLEFGSSTPAIYTEYDLVTTLATQAECPAWTEGQSHGICSSHFDASNTVYVGITGLDSSTYRYPGVGATDPGGNLPTPASLPLVLAAIGAAAVGTVRPRRARRC